MTATEYLEAKLKESKVLHLSVTMDVTNKTEGEGPYWLVCLYSSESGHRNAYGKTIEEAFVKLGLK